MIPNPTQHTYYSPTCCTMYIQNIFNYLFFCLKWNHFTIYRAIIRTQWNFTSMTAINAKTFGKSVWNTIPFFGAPQAWRVRGKSTDFWVEAPRFGKNFYKHHLNFPLTQWLLAREMYKSAIFLYFWNDREFVFLKTN